MDPYPGFARRLLFGCLLILASRCGGSSGPSAPTPSGPAVTAVQVGVAGNAAPMLAPGESKQLFALANGSDGSTQDITNLATWQSSNPVVATVSSGGVLTAAAEGALDVSATYKGVRGILRADVRRCELTISPASASFTAFGGTQIVDVAASTGDCRWTAISDAAWFPFGYDSPRAGSGSFSYTLPPNSTTASRTANIVVSSGPGASAAVHTITEGRPVSCSYVTSPEERTVTAAGGSGSFDVITSPGDCRWNASSTMTSLGVFITSGYSGTGNGRVTYSVQAHARSVDVDGYIEIAGLSGQNPPGRHHVIVLKR